MSFKLTESPGELRMRFESLCSPEDLATLLEIPYTHLTYYLYRMPNDMKYKSFELSKPSGQTRLILSPHNSIKILQQKLNQVLQAVYEPKASVHGFTVNRNIITNAEKHIKRKYVLNLDIVDFFPSINFGRVRGMFQAIPYNLPERVATVLAQLCCFQNQLPQGAPTSPIISNMICAKMDSQLRHLAYNCRCTYTRYADDITLSTSMPYFPKQLAFIKSTSDEDNDVEIGSELFRVIESNGFKINYSKVRLQTKNHRQEVTGLTVNQFPNVKRTYLREIRAMLHCWKVQGLTVAEEIFHTKYDPKDRNPDLPLPSFKKVLRGKIEFLGMVRGKEDKLYIRYLNELSHLDPGKIKIPISFKTKHVDAIKPTLYVEGKTDKKILAIAWAKLMDSRSVPFVIKDSNLNQTDDGGGLGGADILKKHISAIREDNLHIAIAMFDQDYEGIKCYDSLPKYFNNIPELGIKVAGHGKAAAFLLPASQKKQDYLEVSNLSIEFLFDETALTTKTKDGKGLEFQYPKIKRTINMPGNPIIEEEESDKPETRSITKGKWIFANEIVPTLNQEDFAEFRYVFAKIAEIITYLSSLKT